VLCLFSVRELIYQTGAVDAAVWIVVLVVNAGSAWLAIGQRPAVRIGLVVGIVAAAVTLVAYFVTSAPEAIESIDTIALVAVISLVHNGFFLWQTERATRTS
jgi:hypothetical protein